MKDGVFEELIASVREGGAILRGKKKPSREFNFDRLDVKRMRASYDLSQGEFAGMLGISVATLRNWEQGRRLPEGPARVLLQVAARHPEILLELAGGTGTKPPKSPHGQAVGGAYS